MINTGDRVLCIKNIDNGPVALTVGEIYIAYSRRKALWLSSEYINLQISGDIHAYGKDQFICLEGLTEEEAELLMLIYG